MTSEETMTLQETVLLTKHTPPKEHLHHKKPATRNVKRRLKALAVPASLPRPDRFACPRRNEQHLTS